jgi:hypothetical protein
MRRYQDHVENSKHMVHVMFFTKDDCKVQVILTNDISTSTLLDSFDISVCAVAWDLVKQQFCMDDDVSDDVANGVMHLRNTVNKHTVAERVAKYTGRGFALSE